jgi:hypothetical protein
MTYTSGRDIKIDESGTNNVIISITDKINSNLPDYVWQGYATQPIDYSPELARIMREDAIVWYRLGHRERLRHIAPSIVTKYCGNEYKRWLMALEGYDLSPGITIPTLELIENIVNKDYAAFLKLVRRASFLESSSGYSLEEDPKLNGIPRFHIKDIGQIFNYKYWFFWSEEPGDDWKHFFLPLDRPSKETEIQFKKALREILPDAIISVPEEEVQLANSSSTCLSSLDPRVKSKVWKEKNMLHNGFSKKPLYGMLSYAHKGPLEVRECIVLTVEQSNSVKLIDKQVMEVIEKIKTSAQIRSTEKFHKRISKFFDKFQWFVNRDLTKEGMTKPRFLLKWMIEELEIKFPLCPAWKYKEIYNSLTILNEGEDHVTKRGHGLGMANALTTLMQCTVFKMITNKDKFIEEVHGNFGALFFNDDGSIGFSDENDAIRYGEFEEETLEELGLLRKATKTDISLVGVICENYKGGMNHKESYGRYIHRLPFAACNIIQAKAINSVCWSPEFGEPETLLLDELTQFYGWERFPEERNVPYAFGGWVAPTIRGVRLDLIQMEPSLYRQGIELGEPKLKPSYHKKTKKGMTYTSPFEDIYGIDLDRETSKLFGFKISMGEAQAAFQRNYNRESIESWLDSQANLRRNLKVKPKRQPSDLEVYNWLVETHPTKDFLPTPEICNSISEEECSIYGLKNKLPLSNSLMRQIKHFKKDAIAADICPIPGFPGIKIAGKKSLTASERQSEEYLINAVSPGFIPRAFEVYTSNRILTRHDWIDSYSVWDVYKSIYNTKKYPIPLMRSKGADIIKDGENHIFEWESCEWEKETQIGENLFGWSFIRQGGTLEASLWATKEVYSSLKEEQNSVVSKDTISSEYGIKDFKSWQFSGKPWNIPEYTLNLFLSFDEVIVMNNIIQSSASLGNEFASLKERYPQPDGWLGRLWLSFVGIIEYNEALDLNMFIIQEDKSFWDMDSEEDEGGTPYGDLWGQNE